MYVIKKLNILENCENVWNNVDSIKLENYPWDTTGYKPNTEVKLFYTDNELKIKFTSTEKQIRIEETNFNGSVWHDSCVEFFFLPDNKNDSRYFNFEISASGVLLLQIGVDGLKRHSMTYINPEAFEIKAIVTKENFREFDNFKPWTVEYKIPFIFIKDMFPEFKAESGSIIKGNFYKCGNKTLIPHFGAWANIINEKPAFHKPEFFQDIIFE